MTTGVETRLNLVTLWLVFCCCLAKSWKSTLSVVSINLHELSISANRLSKLDGKYFKGMESLTTLDLSRNAIHAVSPNDFKFLTNLVTLDLSINRIRCFHPDSFLANSVLNKLSLGYNHHLNLPSEESLINSNSLKILDLSNSNIVGLPSKTFQNTTKLGTISLNGNQLETLEKETFSHLDGLVHLDVQNNDFTCDCKLASTYRWAQNRTVNALVECKNPLEYAGSSWAVLNGTCKNFTTTSRQNFRWAQNRTVIVSVECKNPLEYAGSSWAVLNGTCKNFTTTSRQNFRYISTCRNHRYGDNIDHKEPYAATRTINVSTTTPGLSPTVITLNEVVESASSGICISILSVLAMPEIKPGTLSSVGWQTGDWVKVSESQDINKE
uniref:LRRCT domain-containing protein n=1 Tax=Timema cristinae TaxID=61476 RepID=A0A7R9H884_TIMCR|nr:unnamed protein product [Timema cristinae]